MTDEDAERLAEEETLLIDGYSVRDLLARIAVLEGVAMSQIMRCPPCAARATRRKAQSRGLVRYPIQLEDGIFAFLHLPSSLTVKDVQRITAMMQAIQARDDFRAEFGGG
jgi:hypothetical protein